MYSVQNSVFGFYYFFLSYRWYRISLFLPAYHYVASITNHQTSLSYWERTGGKYNTATMNIKYDSNTYTTERFGGWLCLQHSGKQGEKVIFYTNDKIKRNNKNQIHIFASSHTYVQITTSQYRNKFTHHQKT